MAILISQSGETVDIINILKVNNTVDYSNINIQVEESLKDIYCDYYNKFNNITILGDGLDYPSCLEGVMKIKEVSYYVSVIIFQYIALGLSKLRKTNTDTPRNLAKSITVVLYITYLSIFLLYL